MCCVREERMVCGASVDEPSRKILNRVPIRVFVSRSSMGRAYLRGRWPIGPVHRPEMPFQPPGEPTEPSIDGAQPPPHQHVSGLTSPPGTEWLSLPSMNAAAVFPAPAGSDAPEGERMVVDVEEADRLSQVSTISFAPRTDDELSEGKLGSSLDQANDPQVNPLQVPETSFPRTPEAEFSMARRINWADDPLTDEEELELLVETRPAADEPVPPAWPASGMPPSSKVVESREGDRDRELRPHRSLHREAKTGRTFVLEFRRTPLSPTPHTSEPLRRPVQAEPGQSRGAIPMTTKRGLPRSPVGASASGGRRSTTTLMERERSPPRRSSPPPPMSPQPTTSAGQDSARGASPLPTFQRRLRFTSPSGRLLSCREVYREELRGRWPIVIRPHVGPPTVRDGTRRARKLRGCRFGNLRSIPSDRTLDPPPHICSNCRQDCKDGQGHETLDCPDPYIEHCENCGRRGVHFMDCPRCGETYVRDGYYIENEWAAADRPSMPEPGASHRNLLGHAAR